MGPWSRHARVVGGALWRGALPDLRLRAERDSVRHHRAWNDRQGIVPWIRDAEAVIYWGDMGADGLDILDGLRAAGIPVRSIFMDRAAYQRWEA